MGRVEACICCQEITAVENKIIAAVTSGECQEEPKCITQHPGFHPVCINRWVLQTAWYQYKQQYKDPYDGPEHKLFRHIAYRQLARWCWGILGKEIRVVLPSCAVMCIRNFYPPPGPEEEFAFEGFRYADEWFDEKFYLTYKLKQWHDVHSCTIIYFTIHWTLLQRPDYTIRKLVIFALLLPILCLWYAPFVSSLIFL